MIVVGRLMFGMHCSHKFYGNVFQAFNYVNPKIGYVLNINKLQRYNIFFKNLLFHWSFSCLSDWVHFPNGLHVSLILPNFTFPRQYNPSNFSLVFCSPFFSLPAITGLSSLLYYSLSYWHAWVFLRLPLNIQVSPIRVSLIFIVYSLS